MNITLEKQVALCILKMQQAKTTYDFCIASGFATGFIVALCLNELITRDEFNDLESRIDSIIAARYPASESMGFNTNITGGKTCL